MFASEVQPAPPTLSGSARIDAAAPSGEPLAVRLLRRGRRLLDRLRGTRGRRGRVDPAAELRLARTELARLKGEQARLRKAIDELKDHARPASVPQRRDLFANLSHDLRTPMVSLRGYLDVLVSKGDTLAADQRARYLAVALRQSDNLGRLLEELFELAQLEFEDPVPHNEPFALAELVTDVLLKFQLQAEQGGVRLDFDAAPGLPFVHADLSMIERVLDNLIGNAMKHTPAGGRVCVALRTAEGRMWVHIDDTGCGIAPDELPHVFDRFYRGSNNARVGGAGLGLAITRRILELHGCGIEIASERGHGTQCSFDLPLAGTPGAATRTAA